MSQWLIVLKIQLAKRCVAWRPDMSSVALVIALLLASQVGGAERYGAPAAPAGQNSLPPGATDTPSEGGSPPASTNAGAATPPAENDATTGLQPLTPSSPPASPPASQPPPGGSNRGNQLGGSRLGNGPNPFSPSSAPMNRGQASPPPAADQSPYTPVQSSPATGSGPKPTAIMKQMMTPPTGAQLTGSPVTLREAVAGTQSRAEQAQLVEAYWDLCSSVADYYLGVLEQNEMRHLRTENPRAGQAIQQAEAKFAVRLGTSKQAAVASQRRLGSMMGRGSGNLPLPADFPHCGSYQSFHDKIFASRPSIEAKELDALLPLRYTELKDAAATVVQTRASLDSIARGDSDGMATLRALELLALQRRAFVQIARDYNRRIARYAELSTPGYIGADPLVDMLIRRDNTPTATRPSLPTGTNGRQSQNLTLPPPPTFVADDRLESIGSATDNMAVSELDRENGVIQTGNFEETSSLKEMSGFEEEAANEASGSQERSLLVAPIN